MKAPQFLCLELGTSCTLNLLGERLTLGFPQYLGPTYGCKLA